MTAAPPHGTAVARDAASSSRTCGRIRAAAYRLRPDTRANRGAGAINERGCAFRALSCRGGHGEYPFVEAADVCDSRGERERGRVLFGATA
ncbi:hypothetical protein MRX96_015950 [Rhipicephalus microplus]